MTSDQYDSDAQELYQRGDYEAALAVFRDGLAHFPQDPDLMLGCAMAHVQLGDYVQACEILEELRRGRGRGHIDEVLQGLAETYLCLGKKAKAVECMEEALSREGEPEFLNSLALTLYRHNQFKEAARCYGRAVDIYPGYAPGHLGYGVCCHRLGNTRAAVEALRRAISADPAYWEAYSYLGNLLYDLRKRTEAKALLGKIPVEKLWDPAAMKRLIRLCARKEDSDKRKAVELRQKEVERILQQSRERGLLDDLSARLEREIWRKQPRNSSSFWSGQAAAPVLAREMDEVLKRMFEAPCSFEDGRRPRLVRFDKALCERYLYCLTRFLNEQRKSIVGLGPRANGGAKRMVERCDAAALLFYGAEIIREMRRRFKDRIIDKSVITRLQGTLQKFKSHANLSVKARAAWSSAAEALGLQS